MTDHESRDWGTRDTRGEPILPPPADIASGTSRAPRGDAPAGAGQVPAVDGWDRVVAGPSVPGDGAWDDVVTAEVAQIAGRLNLLHARLVEVTARVIDADAWGAHGGIRSPEHWLTLRAGISHGTAAQIVTLARARRRLPTLTGLVDDGRLSLDQAGAIAARVPIAYEDAVCDLAPLMTVTQLRRTLSRYPFDTDVPATAATPTIDPSDHRSEPDPATRLDLASSPTAQPDTPAAHGAREGAGEGEGAGADGSVGDPAAALPTTTQVPAPAPAGAAEASSLVLGDEGIGRLDPARPSELSLWWDEGRLMLRGSFDALDGALIENALREAKDARFHSTDPDTTLATAMTEIASRSLAALSSPSRAAHYRIYLHLDTEGAWINARGTLVHALATRIGCLAPAAPLWHTQGLPISVGRTHHALPERTRRLVEDRDRGCVYPGCGATRHVEIHHIHHQADGGGHDYDNLACLCPHHHAAHHRGDFTIAPTRNPLVPFTLTNRSGRTIQVHPPHPPRDPGDQQAPGDPGDPAGPGGPGQGDPGRQGDPGQGDPGRQGDSGGQGDPGERDEGGQGGPRQGDSGRQGDPGERDKGGQGGRLGPGGRIGLSALPDPGYQPPSGERLDTNWIHFRKKPA